MKPTSGGFTLATQVLVFVLFSQLVVAVLNPPEDKFGYLGVVVVVDLAMVAIITAVTRKRPR